MAEVTAKPAPDILSIVEESCGAFWQVGAWPETVDEVARFAGEAINARPGAPGEIAEGTEGALVRIAPTLWWILDAAPLVGDRLAVLKPEQGTVLDMTSNRRRFRVTGEKARACMMRMAPIDFRDASFPEGRFASTVAHHMSVQIARRGGGYEIYVPGSFARTLAELLEETATQWG